MAKSYMVDIVVRGNQKGTIKTIGQDSFNQMISNNLEASFELEGIKRTSRNRDKIKNASIFLEQVI